MNSFGKKIDVFFRMAVFVLFCCVMSCAFGYAQENVLGAIDARINRLQLRYGIVFQYKGLPKTGGKIKFSEVPQEKYRQLNDYLSLFEKEINKYPPGFFKDHGVKGIGLVTRLFARERSAQGLYISGLRVMFFDISRFSRNKAQQRSSIHHEIFHMMQEIKGGFELLSDEAWGALNSPDFFYSKGPRRFNEENSLNYYAPRTAGFVTYYAMEAVKEDQAEVFACLMLEKHRKLIEKWALEDKVLAKKIEVIKNFAQYYHPGMGEGFW